jgi:hypothetical protein
MFYIRVTEEEESSVDINKKFKKKILIEYVSH